MNTNRYVQIKLKLKILQNIFIESLEVNPNLTTAMKNTEYCKFTDLLIEIADEVQKELREE
jgi:hypothetical protein